MAVNTNTWSSTPELCHAPVAHSEATRAVNPGVVSSNPSSAKSISDIRQKSLWRASFVFHQWAYSLCEKAASWFEIFCSEKARKHMIR